MKARKIDDSKLISLLNEGKLLQKEIAAQLGVTPAAIVKRTRRLFPERYRLPESLKSLTEKERAFVIEKAKGRSNTEACLAVYECGSRESAKVLGCQLMNKPEIQQSLSDCLICVGLTKLYRAQKLKIHTDSIDPNVSLRALDMVFKVDGDYAPQKVVTVNESYVQVNVNIERLKSERLKLEKELAALEAENEAEVMDQEISIEEN